MKVAIVGLNSAFKSGATSFMFHLGYKADNWDILLFNDTGKALLNYDIPIDGFPVKSRYVKDTDAKILESYDFVIFAAPRWNGKYDFLKGLRLNKTGIIIHDHNDFLRMGINDIIELFPKSIIFCLDNVVKNMVSKSVRISQPFDGELLPKVSGYMMDNGISSTRDRFICTSRFSGSKYPQDIARAIDGKYSLHFFGVDKKVFDIEQYGNLFKTPNITLIERPVTSQELAVAYTKAKGLLDASDFKANYDRTQYTVLEAWYFGAIPLIKSCWFSNETVNNETCLELTNNNIKAVWNHFGDFQHIADNGRKMLKNHSPEKVREEILINV